ncbi:MAG: hypothetical protein A2X94_04200 [Bdellovibrionales bacterium GWB1_55_8]|nr:MAG: hypothetical protein A2X94_04200 [Bdellovibrionales bacterium GWB1_55_8]
MSIRPGRRQSLYSRALLFTLVGCGCLLGAILVQSWIMVNGTVDRLLQERISLAKSTASYVEQHINYQLEQLSRAAAETLSSSPMDLREVRKSIGALYTGTVFEEGAFVLWRDGRPLASVPEDDLLEELPPEPIAALVAQSRNSGRIAASSLTHLGKTKRPVLIFLQPIQKNSGPILGYIGGLLHPASNNLLAPFTPGGSGTRSILQLVDSTGTVVSSTSPALLFDPTDHDSMLKRAIQERREIKGRCHSCHDSAGGAPASRESEVLAFAPLRHLPFGMAIRQPEHEALGPAFALQSRLIWLGVAFVVLFVGFTALSVHSVVSPVKRLTHAVRVVENMNSELRLPSFGHDEIGELANALERWRNRVIESVATLELRERDIHNQFVATTRHLKALQEIGNLGSEKQNLQDFLNDALAAMLKFFGFQKGKLTLTHGERHFVATNRSPEEDGQSVDAAAELKFGEMGVSCSLDSPIDRSHDLPANRIESLLHQILVSAAHRLLHERDAERHKQSREFLQGVLRAQEEERRRIARELHDTLAQDLAAHRFEIERMIKHSPAGPESELLKPQLAALEIRAHEMLITLRRLLLDLRPSVLDTMGFLPALQWYLERLEREHGIRGRVSAESDGLHLSPESEMNLFRIFQEALNNVVQHSQAQHVFVTINQADNMVEMVIEDDGRGFDLASLKTRPTPSGTDERGLGLLGITERSELLGGQMQVQSTPGEGTNISVRIPAGEIS